MRIMAVWNVIVKCDEVRERHRLSCSNTNTIFTVTTAL